MAASKYSPSAVLLFFSLLAFTAFASTAIGNPHPVFGDQKEKHSGIYASASQDQVGLLMTMNFAFMTGKYNGSNLSILGRNTVFSEVREMPVVGGSGLFRWGRGYAQARTHMLDLKTGDAVVEYNVYVMHY